MASDYDLKVDIEMYFKQILGLLDLMINQENDETVNLITLRDLAQLGLNKSIDLNTKI